LSLLQRKPDEWRRQHATPSSSGATASSANDVILKYTAPSAGTVPTNEHDDREEEAPGKSSPVKVLEKRKRGAAADEIDVLFDDVIGRRFVRGALDVSPALRLRSGRPRREKGRARKGSGHTLTSEPSWMR
jgi:hypothetical protein